MAETASRPVGASAGRVLSMSVDYSEDELDALADIFGVPALGSARLRNPPATPLAEAVLRASLGTAIRGLVARRAIMLGGTALRPEIEFLEPHGSFLSVFLGAQATFAVRRDGDRGIEQHVVFVRDATAVEQRTADGRAILRMTAYPVAQTRSLVLGPVGLLDDARAAVEAPAVEVTLDGLDRGIATRGADCEGTVLEALADVLHARRFTGEAVVARTLGARVERSEVRWLDAGELGLWVVEPGVGEPPVTATVRPVGAAELRTLLQSEEG